LSDEHLWSQSPTSNAGCTKYLVAGYMHVSHYDPMMVT
jgi:hypothetical protein